VSPEICSALTDSDPRWTLGGPAWSADVAVALIRRRGNIETLPSIAVLVRKSLAPAPRQWIGDRLTVLVSQFSVNRTAVDVETLTAWMSETMRLLADVPHDILATSIDQAIRSGRSGFMPTVGEIMAVAEPLMRERNQQADRLAQMIALIEDRGVRSDRTTDGER
jgi:hypothetical protein